MKDNGIEDQILMKKLKKTQEECVLCRGYRRKEIRIGLSISEKRKATKIKKLKGGIETECGDVALFDSIQGETRYCDS